MPPGAFIGVGFMIALKNVIDKKRAQKATHSQSKPVIERARVSTTD
ncbi:electron transport complex protein RnfE [Photobacterium aphoticum]|uniref:Electron transport complex protein RnfE n=1 Tax=Photobacterium aphoticum TaxID=754436 RepID=A0A090QWL0_9GAMM|nr:electron transport complex protein RnfE [Photobacterium aphoticum]